MSRAHRNLMHGVSVQLYRGRLLARNKRFVDAFRGTAPYNQERFLRLVGAGITQWIRWRMHQPSIIDLCVPMTRVTA